MKKESVAGLITVLLLLSSALVLYVFVVRTTSGQKAAELSDTVRVLGERVDELERQRDLLADSASTLEGEAEALRKRVRHIDAEIQNMRGLLASAGKDVGGGSFSWRRLRITTASGLIIVAFLAFIWMLYSASQKEEVREDSSLPPAAGEGEEERGPVPGSVLEEEFSPGGGEEEQAEAPAEGRPAEKVEGEARAGEGEEAKA